MIVTSVKSVKIFEDRVQLESNTSIDVVRATTFLVLSTKSTIVLILLRLIGGVEVEVEVEVELGSDVEDVVEVSCCCVEEEFGILV